MCFIYFLFIFQLSTKLFPKDIKTVSLKTVSFYRHINWLWIRKWEIVFSHISGLNNWWWKLKESKELNTSFLLHKFSLSKTIRNKKNYLKIFISDWYQNWEFFSKFFHVKMTLMNIHYYTASNSNTKVHFFEKKNEIIYQ